MPKYVIPVTYTMYGKYEIEADSIEAALDAVFDDVLPVPENAEYLSDSLVVTTGDVQENNPRLDEEAMEFVDEYLTERYR